MSLRDCYNVSVFLAPSVVGLGFASPRGGPGHPSICVGPGAAGKEQPCSTLFTPPSCSLPQLPLLEDKLQAELPEGARVVSGRFPLPTWQPVAVVGEGLDRVWAYDIHSGGPTVQASPAPSSVLVPRVPETQAG